MNDEDWPDSSGLSDRAFGDPKSGTSTERGSVSISDFFLGLTRRLQERYDISRGLLLVREKASTQFIAVSTWSDSKSRKNLSLRIPGVSSLFDKVAESGQLYSESYCDLFSGNSFERNLLLSPTAQSFVLQPLKFEGQVVGLLGYSSESPSAFATFEASVFTRITDQLARLVVGRQPAGTSS